MLAEAWRVISCPTLLLARLLQCVIFVSASSQQQGGLRSTLIPSCLWDFGGLWCAIAHIAMAELGVFYEVGVCACGTGRTQCGIDYILIPLIPFGPGPPWVATEKNPTNATAARALASEVVSQIWSRFGRAEVDLFAARGNAQCALWFALSVRDNPRLGVDAFAH